MKAHVPCTLKVYSKPPTGITVCGS